ncbi:TPA: hypothetical protein ACH3X1_000774 [Trebouxia sp. C0004]
MHHSSGEHVGHSRGRSAPQACKRQADPVDQFSQSGHSEKDCCSQLGSSVSAFSDMQMSSPAEVQLESDLQCEERHHFLSSPQDSNTSALSYHDPGRLCSPQPVNRHSSTAHLPSPRLEHSRPSPSEVPTEALWDTESVACHARPGYTDPGPCSAIFQIAITYGFTPLMVSLGTSYFRRLAASNYAMLQLSLESAQFCDFMLPMEMLPPGQTAKPLVGAVHAKYLPTKEAWLTLIHLTCIYLAAKVLEYVPCKNMLQTMMAHVYGADPCNVSTDVVTHLELECLQALDWRLGPVYKTEL